MTYGRFNVHPVADMFPLTQGEEFSALVADIAKRGLGHDIVLAPDGETIVDGRNRYRACEAALVDPRFVTLPSVYTDEMVVEFIMSENVHRRHMTAPERAFVGAQLMEYEQARAEQRRAEAVARGNQRHVPPPPVPVILPELTTDPFSAASDARDVVGEKLGVSGTYVDMAHKMLPHPDLVAAVTAGQVPIAEANKQRVARDREAARVMDPPPGPAPVMLTLLTHRGEAVAYPQPRSPATFNESSTDGISWAAWSWNPVTGCLHGCNYCYAREIATNPRYASVYPVGFTPLFHPERLDAPINTRIPRAHLENPAYRRVFVCSMADLYGRWVPDEWIEAVHHSMLAAAHWQYITLTKFPDRYVGLQMPPGAWVGTSVDEQNRVRIAEKAMRQLPDHVTKWLSLEPLLADLEFEDLSAFDWVVIGAQTATTQPDGRVPALAPDFEWVAKITLQARAAGCRVHHKPNLFNGNPGMKMLDEYPA